MTQEEIIEMGKQAGMDYLQYISPEAFEKVVAFVELVAQHEREACAQLAENMGPCGFTGESSANAIRLRGQA